MLYTTSDINSIAEIKGKIHVKSKPLSNRAASISAPFNELRAAVENLWHQQSVLHR